MFSMIWYGNGVFQIFETELRTVKTAFCEYWTSIKILYEIKGVTMTATKTKVFIGL